MIPGGYYPDSDDYDVEKLREAIGVDKNDSEFTLPNYKCQTCGCFEHIDDHKQHAPNWCEFCDDVKRFERLNTE